MNIYFLNNNSPALKSSEAYPSLKFSNTLLPSTFKNRSLEDETSLFSKIDTTYHELTIESKTIKEQVDLLEEESLKLESGGRVSYPPYIDLEEEDTEATDKADSEPETSEEDI